MSDKLYIHFSTNELLVGLKSMRNELINAPKWVCILFDMAWKDFKESKFSYDGATFVRERYDDTLFEVASFIHDWLNANGIVSYEADGVFLKIMKVLKYPKRIRFERWLLTRLTFLNILRHRFLIKDYKGKYAIELMK